MAGPALRPRPLAQPQAPGQTPRPNPPRTSRHAPPRRSRAQAKPTESSRASKTHQNLIHNPQRTNALQAPSAKPHPPAVIQPSRPEPLPIRDTASSTPQATPLKASLWRRTGSNRRPPACKAGALPTELRPRAKGRAPAPHQAVRGQAVVGQGGLEPPTPRLSSVCSNQLSY